MMLLVLWLLMVSSIGWASISGSLLASDVNDGGPGLSIEYIHVSAMIDMIIDSPTYHNTSLWYNCLYYR